MIAHQQCKLDAIPNREYLHTASTHKHINCIPYAQPKLTLMTLTQHDWVFNMHAVVYCVIYLTERILSAKQTRNFNYSFFFPSLFLHTFKLCAATVVPFSFHSIPLLLFCMGIWYIARALITHDYCFCCWPFNLIITKRINVMKKILFCALFAPLMV